MLIWSKTQLICFQLCFVSLLLLSSEKAIVEPCVNEKVMGTALLDEVNEDITKGPLAGLANGNELKDLNLLF